MCASVEDNDAVRLSRTSGDRCVGVPPARIDLAHAVEERVLLGSTKRD